MWRLALSPDLKDGLTTMLETWTIDQALDAHAALNFLEARRAEQYEQATKKP